MAVTLITSPFAFIVDSNGGPLDGGSVYIGAKDQNPETHPVAVYYDDGLTQPAAQPLITSNGYFLFNGSAARVYTSGEHSMTVRDKKGELVYTVANSKAAELLDLYDFGAVGDNVTDDSAAFAAAEAAQQAGTIGAIYIPPATFFCDEQVFTPEGFYYGLGSVRYGGDGTYTDTTVYPAPAWPSLIWARLHNNNKRGLNTISGLGSGESLDMSDPNSARFSMFIGDRSGSLAVVSTRATAVGSNSLREHPAPTYMDAFGADAMKHTKFGNRVLALGNNAGKWGGDNVPAEDDHDSFDQDNVATWQNNNHEGVYPNVGDEIWDAGTFTYDNMAVRTAAEITQLGTPLAGTVATVDEDFEDSVFIGRDSGIHVLKGKKLTFVGYKSGGQLLDGNRVSLFGRSAGENAIWADSVDASGHGAISNSISSLETTVSGVFALNKAASVKGSAVFGFEALFNVADPLADTAFQMTSKTDYQLIGAVALGAKAGKFATTATNSIILGTRAAAATSTSAANLDHTLIVGDGELRSRPTLVGDLNTGRVGVNMWHDDDGGAGGVGLPAFLTVTDGTPTTAAFVPDTDGDGLLVKGSGHAIGASIMADDDRTANLFLGTRSTPKGIQVQYLGADGYGRIRFEGNTMMSFHDRAGIHTINMSDLPTSATGLNGGDLYKDTGTKTIKYA